MKNINKIVLAFLSAALLFGNNVQAEEKAEAVPAQDTVVQKASAATFEDGDNEKPKKNKPAKKTKKHKKVKKQ